MVKVISLSNPAYEKLKGMKQGQESFSDVVLKLVEKGKKKSLLEFAGVWSHMTDNDADQMKKSIEQLRKKSTADLLERMKKYDMP